MVLYPCAKINLGLNVVNKRVDGYHDLETVFFPVGIHDELAISVSSDSAQKHPCMLHLEGLKVDGDPQKNLVVKAYDLLAGYFSLPKINVKLVKRIPMQAGMGGGSSDCAYMIRALNETFCLGLSIKEMQGFAAKLGADCAFFIDPRPSYAEGIGEKLKTISLDLGYYKIVIVKPPVAISTKEAFSHITPKQPEERCIDIVKDPVETWKDRLVNDFELSVMPEHPEISDIKSKLYTLGAEYAAMSGSGSAIFGLFKDVPSGLSNEFEGCFTAVTNSGNTIK